MATDIQSAVDAASDGDTVLVGDGKYHVSKPIQIQKSLTVRSRNGRDTAIIDANRSCRIFQINLGRNPSSGSVALEGLTITQGFSKGQGGAIIASGEWPLRISNCIVENSEAGDNGGGIYVIVHNKTANSVIIEDCFVRENRASNCGGGIYLGAWDEAKGDIGTILIQGCLIEKNEAKGAGGGVCCTGGVMASMEVSDCRISKNSTVSGGGGGIVLGVHYQRGRLAENNSADNRIVSCTIADNSGGGVILNPHEWQKTVVLNSIVYQNRMGSDIDPRCIVSNSCARNVSSGNGNVSDNPKFMNAKIGDYRLQPDSPCIDAGSNSYTNSITDLDGNSRIMDGDRDGEAVVDMGAYEFQVINVVIDIKPGSKSNSINLKSGGLLPVAILTTGTFDASTVDPASVCFAEAVSTHRELQDVDADGDVDLLLQFQRRRLKLGKDSTKVLLTGETKDGQSFIGNGEIAITHGK
ncbi:choice-of-anchor Q domain-containing protein [Pontiella sulfatireligans]|uniref:choice-of-anchor Q domain-containing protein n=1 Tax=Pontiella sulfatireligans TaxID=2750658 RepID=UPI00109CF444|nr:choice-of-anchor Q domain-containing protein [Pontiella sulfatireligans]